MLDVLKAHGAWWMQETTVYAPSFAYLQKAERTYGHSITLLLGFWQTSDGGTTWYRFGGHFVTLSGIDIFGPTYQFSFSDPALDNAEAGGFGIVCHSDPFPHVGNFIVHNNPHNTSKDYYTAAWPSASPGGVVYLPDYVVNWPDFQGQNFRPEHLPFQGTYSIAFPVQVEVEQAIELYPGAKGMQGEVQSSKAYEVNNNSGGLNAFGVTFGTNTVSGLYKGSIVAGTSQSDLNNDYGNYSPARTLIHPVPRLWIASP